MILLEQLKHIVTEKITEKEIDDIHRQSLSYYKIYIKN